MNHPIPVREADVQRAILDWLAAERIWHIRLNAGAMAGQHKGKKWFVRFGRPGMADILAVPKYSIGLPPGKYTRKHHDKFKEPLIIEMARHCEMPFPVWIEVKGPNGAQTEQQKQFQFEVTEAGHHYILARSLDDVIAVLK